MNTNSPSSPTPTSRLGLRSITRHTPRQKLRRIDGPLVVTSTIPVEVIPAHPLSGYEDR
jgi:hypothetical protein